VTGMVNQSNVDKYLSQFAVDQQQKEAIRAAGEDQRKASQAKQNQPQHQPQPQLLNNNNQRKGGNYSNYNYTTNKKQFTGGVNNGHQ
jgi:hypothetical protein